MSELKPINANDKRIILGETDTNQLAPFKYHWAWQAYLDANANHWTPLDISMAEDKAQWETGALTEQEIHMYETVLAYLTTSDIVVMRNITMAVIDNITAPEVEVYLTRQAFEESLHTWTYQHCIETLGLDEGRIYNLYRTIWQLDDKIRLSAEYTDKISNANGNVKELLEGLIFYYLGFEGGWFYNGFTPIFALQRRMLMIRTGEQFQYIMRDEAMHASIGTRIINTIIQENNIDHSWVEETTLRIFDKVVKCENNYAQYAIPGNILGYNWKDHVDQLKYLLNRRAAGIGNTYIPYPNNIKCPFPWLDQQTSIRKEKNFFETTVTEYRRTGLNWDEE